MILRFFHLAIWMGVFGNCGFFWKNFPFQTVKKISFPNCQNLPFSTVKICLFQLSKFAFFNCQNLPFSTVKICLFQTVKICLFQLSKFAFSKLSKISFQTVKIFFFQTAKIFLSKLSSLWAVFDNFTKYVTYVTHKNPDISWTFQYICTKSRKFLNVGPKIQKNITFIGSQFKKCEKIVEIC
jgi:hypothetical protein